jgi:hypothetical protein
MFDPSKLKKKNNEKEMKKQALNHVKELCLQIIPKSIQDGLILDVNEQVCGDPSCSPIDTVISLVWQSGGRGIFGVPMESKEIQIEDLHEVFPVSFRCYI